MDNAHFLAFPFGEGAERSEAEEVIPYPPTKRKELKNA